MAPSAEDTTPQRQEVVHATAVAIDGRAALLIGASGSGKSATALQLLALGADLISDDRTVLSKSGTQILATAAPNIVGKIEARGVGILRARTVRHAMVTLVVDLDQQETDRLPPWRTKTFLSVELPCVHKVECSHFPAAIMQYLRYGRAD